jgi:hypothetical protein
MGTNERHISQFKCNLSANSPPSVDGRHLEARRKGAPTVDELTDVRAKLLTFLA